MVIGKIVERTAQKPAKSKLLLFLLAVGLLGCNQAASAQKEGLKIIPAAIAKKPLVRNGVLRYYGQRPGAVKLKDIPSFLALYTEEELSLVTELFLEMHEISKIEGLNRLPNLRILALGANRIEEISGLEEAPGLEVLSLTQNRITRIKGLEPVVGLKELHLGRNRIERIQNLFSLSSLEVLNLEWNKIRAIEGLGNLKSLRWLIIGGNQLQDYSGLLEIDQVKELSLSSRNNVVDEKAKQVFEEWNRRHPDEPIQF
jgi:hypothetical protein